MYVRVRPPDKHLQTDVDRTPCLEVTSGNTVVLHSKPDPKNFSFDHVADINATQVFIIVGDFNVKDALISAGVCVMSINLKNNWVKKF